MFYCCGITDTGAVRDHNEDAFLIYRSVITDAGLECEVNAPFIAAVADGVAGEAAGEVASRTALNELRTIKPSSNMDYTKKVLDIHRVLRRRGKSGNNPNMQTTLCAIAIDENENATIINVGDSKLFRFRGGKIRQLSTDQSLVQMLYDQGEITAEEKKRHIHRNVIFPVLGNMDADPKIAVTPIEGGICPGDLILICSDGLADYITTGEFEEALSLPMRLPKRLSTLIKLAKEGGSTDNITVVGLSLT